MKFTIIKRDNSKEQIELQTSPNINDKIEYNNEIFRVEKITHSKENIDLFVFKVRDKFTIFNNRFYVF